MVPRTDEDLKRARACLARALAELAEQPPRISHAVREVRLALLLLTGSSSDAISDS